MSKYYLIARDRKTNQFEIVHINGRRGHSLEEIDLFTTGFLDDKALGDYFRSNGVNSFQDVDFFIANQGKNKGITYIKKQEVLYSNNQSIRPIAENSNQGQMQKSQEQVDFLLDDFADRVRHNATLFDQVITGKTGVYDKYAKYLAYTRYQSLGSIKYRDGGWARKSYPLVRNIVEATTRKNTRYKRMSDNMFRDLLDEKLTRVTASNYDENQFSVFDMFPDAVDEDRIDDKLVEVMSVFEKLPRDTFVIQNDHTIFNQRSFPLYQEGDLEKFETLLPESLRYGLQLLAIHRDYLETEPQRFADAYQTPIREGEKTMIMQMKLNKELLEKAYLWCQLYGEYKDKTLGDVNDRGRQKQKQE